MYITYLSIKIVIAVSKSDSLYVFFVFVFSVFVAISVCIYLCVHSINRRFKLCISCRYTFSSFSLKLRIALSRYSLTFQRHDLNTRYPPLELLKNSLKVANHHVWCSSSNSEQVYNKCSLLKGFVNASH